MGEGCQERAGFLFAHACPHPAQEQCSRCGKVVCARHLKSLDGSDEDLCVTCARVDFGQGAGRSRSDDPYFYGAAHYSGYGEYRSGHWGHEYFRASRVRDPNDFTEADGASLEQEGDEAFAQELGAS